MPPVSIPFTLATGAHAPTRATPGAAGLDLHAYIPHGGGALRKLRRGEAV